MKLVAIIFATFTIIQLCTAAPQGGNMIVEIRLNYTNKLYFILMYHHINYSFIQYFESLK